MADPIIHSISLCAGVGMLDVGIDAGLEYLGIDARTVAYCEREAYAASQLLALVESECLDAAPIWPDLTTFPASEFRGMVDCVHGGFPCQPHSVAGSRKGTDDERWIWPDIVRIIRDSGCWLVVLENVRGLLSSGGMGPVLADLAGVGFDAEWGVLSASAVGANHRRERVFIVGVRNGYAGWLADAVRERRQQVARSLPAHARIQTRPDGIGGGNDQQPTGHGPNTMDDAARDGRDRSHGEDRRGRGVREVCGAMDDTRRTERRPHAVS